MKSTMTFTATIYCELDGKEHSSKYRAEVMEYLGKFCADRGTWLSVSPADLVGPHKLASGLVINLVKRPTLPADTIADFKDRAFILAENLVKILDNPVYIVFSDETVMIKGG